jgi:hypothetical protein
VFDTRQTSLCRVSFCAECPALGKESRCRESSFTECGTRQILLCRVPDKRHSTKIATLGKALDSGSDYRSNRIVIPLCHRCLKHKIPLCDVRMELGTLLSARHLGVDGLWKGYTSAKQNFRPHKTKNYCSYRS